MAKNVAFFASMFLFSIYGAIILSIIVKYNNKYYPDYKMEII